MQRFGRVFAAIIMATTLTAILAGTAGATEIKSESSGFTAAGTPLSGKFVLPNGPGVTCQQILLSGTVTSTSSTAISMSPSFENCRMWGYGGVSWNYHGCKLVLQSPPGEIVTGAMKVSCPEPEVGITLTGAVVL
jgi:hypothetical protein